MARILIVEDSLTHAEQLRGVLEGAGYQTNRAENAIEALKSMAVNRPDLILVDYVMPEKN